MKAVNVNDFERFAQLQVSKNIWDYIQGGSDDEVTLRANCAAFECIRLRPHVLVNVNACNSSTKVLGTPVSMPILIAPTAPHDLVHSKGECATAQAAGEIGTLMVVSAAASRTLEEIAHVSSGPLWFQLYIRSLEEAKSLVRRAEAVGYCAIVLTADMPRRGNRERDTRNKFNPTYLHAANYEGNQAASLSVSPTWEQLTWLKSLTSLPLLVKGILTFEDAELAVEHGARGIIVSNHGGRQLDGVQPSIQALPEVVEAAAGRCEVFLDGGIRRGTDVLKALALGAQAVLVGRPILWGLITNGQAGVHNVLELLCEEFVRAMALSGCPTVQKVDRSLIAYVS